MIVLKFELYHILNAIVKYCQEPCRMVQGHMNHTLRIRDILNLLRAVCLEFHSLFSLHGHGVSYNLSSDVAQINTMVTINHIVCSKFVEVLHI